MTEPPGPSSEVLGLLREITENPRSAIRLVPRRPLREWLDGETVRPSEVSRDRAVRHLVAAHREELAQLLYDAAKIAYWKKPSMSHVPVRARSEALQDLERACRKRADWEAKWGNEDERDLLVQCTGDIRASLCPTLAAASLALVPRDDARLYLAHGLKMSKPRSALSLFEWIACHTKNTITRAAAHSGAAGRLCHLGSLDDAAATYEEEARATPESAFPWLYLFNLNCVLGRHRQALRASSELGGLIKGADVMVEEAADHVEQWLREQAQQVSEAARATVRAISDRLSPPAARLTEAYEN